MEEGFTQGFDLADPALDVAQPGPLHFHRWNFAAYCVICGRSKYDVLSVHPRPWRRHLPAFSSHTRRQLAIAYREQRDEEYIEREQFERVWGCDPAEHE